MSTKVDLGGAVVDLVFDRRAVTPKWALRFERRNTAGDPEAAAKALAEVVLTWDVTADGGEPFPPTVENLGALTAEQKAELVTAIVEAKTGRTRPR